MVILRATLLALAITGATAAGARAESPGKTLDFVVEPLATPIVAGEMVPVTLRGVYDQKVAIEEVVLAPSTAFDWIQLVPDRWRSERIGGVSRLVFERRLAIFPKVSGVDTFGPADHVMTMIDTASQREEVTVHAPAVSIAVAPMPEDPPFERPWGWRFAASKLTVTDELSTDPARLRDGETVTRRVTLRAEGALPEMLPPRPVIQQPWLITFAVPVERKLERSEAGVTSTVVWTWQFRPETGEPGVLPPTPIPYFNTVTRKVEAVEIPALPIGYASFHATQPPGSTMHGGIRLGLAAALGLGLAAGLGLQFAGLDRGAGWLGRALRHHSPRPHWRLARTARGGDLLALRRAAVDYLEARGAPAEGSGPAAEALARLDRAIYAPGTTSFDPGIFVRDLRVAARTSPPRA